VKPRAGLQTPARSNDNDSDKLKICILGHEQRPRASRRKDRQLMGGNAHESLQQRAHMCSILLYRIVVY